MSYDTVSPEQLIHTLCWAGRHPRPDLIDAIWDRRNATEPLLLDLFTESIHDQWATEDDPRWYRFVHAGKFMLAWQNQAALPTFARLYAAGDESLLDMCEWFEEDLFHYGPAAIPYLGQVIATESDGSWHYGRALAGSTLTRIATYYPETRDEVVAMLRAQLPSPEASAGLTEGDGTWCVFANDLGALGDEASREQILSLDDAGLLDDSFFDRQLYLRDLNRGFIPEAPPEPYEIRGDYRQQYEWLQARRQTEAGRPQRARQARRQQAIQQQATLRKSPKIGRNEPCPCGSGQKYKRCHGRPGA